MPTPFPDGAGAGRENVQLPMLDLIKSIRWQDLADILVVSFIIYRIILLIRGTRAMQMLAGMVVLLVIYFGARELEFMTLYWLLNTLMSSIFLIIIIVFQRDIRRVLTRVGQTPFGRTGDDTMDSVIEDIVAAAQEMAEKRIGALMIIERETGLKEYFDSGEDIDAKVSKGLLLSIFHTSSPLHDGGVIIKNNRVMHARCLMPLSKNPYISRRLGTRHRAAIGISEETDAVVIVVSEERGQISLVQHGAMTTNIDAMSLRNRLHIILSPREHQKQPWKNWLKKS
ncbi:MAG: diadenylate cyclase CdaA [Thermodesulfobacteriota bacterium]